MVSAWVPVALAKSPIFIANLVEAPTFVQPNVPGRPSSSASARGEIIDVIARRRA
jgi:hypothetical protein